MIERVKEYFEEIDRKRDEIIKKGKDLIKESTRAIVCVHTGNFEEAEKHLENARKIKEEVEKNMDKEVFKFISGYYTTAIQEFVEAVQFISLLKEKKLKSFEEIGVEIHPWILGTFDAIGELSRKIYDLLLNEKKEEAIFYIKLIEDFYNKTEELSVYKFVEGLRTRIDWTRKKIEEFKRLLINSK